MGTVSSSSLAQIRAVSLNNRAIGFDSSNMPHKILIPGQYLVAKTDVVDNVPERIYTVDQAGEIYGYGSMLHRLIKWAFKTNQGTEIWALPLADAGTTVAATKTVTFAGTSTAAGTMSSYINGELVEYSLANGADGSAQATAYAAAITAYDYSPYSAVANAAIVTLTCKTLGLFGNDCTARFNQKAGEVYPAGVTAPVVAVGTAGTGVAAVATALAALGSGDNSNELFFTDVANGYTLNTTIFDAYSVYNGLGNTKTGNYAKNVNRPMRVMSGDTTAGTAGLASTKAIAVARKATDRTNGVCCLPGSPNCASEIAAMYTAAMAYATAQNPERSFYDIALPDLIPGTGADRWTDEYNYQDEAVKAGMSPIVYTDGACYMRNAMSFYNPTTVSLADNGFFSFVAQGKIHNIQYTAKSFWNQDRWKGNAIVADIGKVTSATAKNNVVDIDMVKSGIQELAYNFESRALIYSADYVIENLTAVIRALSNGFDAETPLILSGEDSIIDNEIVFSTNISAILG